MKTFVIQKDNEFYDVFMSMHHTDDRIMKTIIEKVLANGITNFTITKEEGDFYDTQHFYLDEQGFFNISRTNHSNVSENMFEYDQEELLDVASNIIELLYMEKLESYGFYNLVSISHFKDNPDEIQYYIDPLDPRIYHKSEIQNDIIKMIHKELENPSYNPSVFIKKINDTFITTERKEFDNVEVELVADQTVDLISQEEIALLEPERDIYVLITSFLTFVEGVFLYVLLVSVNDIDTNEIKHQTIFQIQKDEKLYH